MSHSRSAGVSASRTQLINCVRGIVKSFGERLPRCSSESFFEKTTTLIPDILRPALDPLGLHQEVGDQAALGRN